MTIPVYPTSLPPPLKEGYQVARGDGRVVVRQDAGPPNIRRRYSAVPKLVTFRTRLTRSQLAVFDTFYDVETKQGTLPFTMPDPGTDGYPLQDENGAPLLDEEDNPIILSSTWLCLFGEQLPVVTPADMMWDLAFTLIVLP